MVSQAGRDLRRDACLRSLGYTVVRFSNGMVLELKTRGCSSVRFSIACPFSTLIQPVSDVGVAPALVHPCTSRVIYCLPDKLSRRMIALLVRRNVTPKWPESASRKANRVGFSADAALTQLSRRLGRDFLKSSSGSVLAACLISPVAKLKLQVSSACPQRFSAGTSSSVSSISVAV